MSYFSPDIVSWVQAGGLGLIAPRGRRGPPSRDEPSGQSRATRCTGARRSGTLRGPHDGALGRAPHPRPRGSQSAVTTLRLPEKQTSPPPVPLTGPCPAALPCAAPGQACACILSAWNAPPLVLAELPPPRNWSPCSGAFLETPFPTWSRCSFSLRCFLTFPTAWLPTQSVCLST